MTNDDLRALLDTAHAANRQFDISGLLFYVGQHFIQTIEGPDAAIGQLIENIRNDNRTMPITLMFDRTVEERAFPNWRMGFRAVPLEDFGNHPGFHNVTSVNDFTAFERNDEAVFSFMENFYENNAAFDEVVF